MKHRTITIDGRNYRVPQHIQRIDCRATHGWQVRYAGTAFFNDAGRSPRASLREASAELASRIAKHPAPTRLQREPSANKTTDLPVGISGPIVRQRPGAKVRESNLLVSLPRFGRVPRRSTIYIGNENTYSVQRFNDALARAIKMREDAEATYRRDATLAKRRQAGAGA